MKTRCYPRSLLNDKTYPVSVLDHVLYKHDKPSITYYCPSTGSVLTADSYKLAINNAIDGKYPGTDHTPFEFTLGSGENALRILYVSLDNSVRANMSKLSLVSSGRLNNICNMINEINPDVVFFSEACRKSFGGNMQEQSNPIYWIEIRQTITLITKMEYCMESTNNFDSNFMSFGMAMFSKSTSLSKIRCIQPYNLLPEDKSKECYGSGCIIMTLKTGEVLVAVHFPLDFKRIGKENNTARALVSLIELLDKYSVAYAMGDMNTVEGTILNSVKEVMHNNKEWKLSADVFTFLPSYCDYLLQEEPMTDLDLSNDEMPKVMSYLD